VKAVALQGGFGIDCLTPVELPEPVPGPHQVLVRVRAASLNYRDLLVVQGSYNPKLRLPLIPLSDGAGDVVSVGSEVSRLRPGDRVAGAFFQGWTDGPLSEAAARSALGAGGPGLLAEYVALDETGVVPVPAHLTDEEAATLPCAAVTAWNALAGTGGLRPGETVLTLGTGGVSLFALQFARLAGARVIVTSSSDAKLERALALGASAGVNYRSTPDWEVPARELAGEAGVDLVVELGGAGTFARSVRVLRHGGRLALIGVLAGGMGEINLTPVLMKAIRVEGIYVGSRAHFEAMNRAVVLHGLHPVIDRVFPFAEVREALRYMQRGDHFGKIVLRW
jgi:NADPH:quinone reductase-like Zn-dependent oxidoreductase